MAGHSRTTSGGTVMAGGVVSRTVIRWTQVLWLLQSSVAVQVRSIKFTVRPGRTGGCGGRVGGGPSGGCCCGGGSVVILFRFPIEIVLLPTVIDSGGVRNLTAASSCAAMVPPTCAGAVESRTIQISTTTWSPTSRPETRNVPRICSSIVPGLTSTELIDSTLALLSGSIAPGS